MSIEVKNVNKHLVLFKALSDVNLMCKQVS